jgi:hypothetical protein
MIRIIRSIKTNNGGPEFIAWCKEMRSLLNEKHPPGFDVHISRVGELGVVHWTADHESLGAWEKWQANLSQDEGWTSRYVALGDRSNEKSFLIPGTAEDLVFTLVD